MTETYTYDAFGTLTYIQSLNEDGVLAQTDTALSRFLYAGEQYDEVTGLYYLRARSYDTTVGRFTQEDTYLGDGRNLYVYVQNNPLKYVDPSGHCKGSIEENWNMGIIEDPALLEWVETVIGTVPDIWSGTQYLSAQGIHTQFAYATETRYMYPIMGETWRWFGKSDSSISNFGQVSQASYKQILTGDARSGLSAIAKSGVGFTITNAALNLGFNLYENDMKFDEAMLKDTLIDTSIGVSSYYLATGTMALITAGVVAAGVAMPGIVVVVGVVALSVGYEWEIRELFDDHQ
ncbi:MAG: RHS repeat-associated core domain-containing protein [Lachnospiraceae bacterium]|nr:RHS repeat-associated core domain-containing protein [Lachnospiraceae bacterium]